jgi:hypothetical protein
MQDSGDDGRANSHVRIEHRVSWIGKRQYKPLDQFHWKLAGMGGLLYMVVLHIREYPDITRILAEGVAGKLPCFRSLEMLLSRIF